MSLGGGLIGRIGLCEHHLLHAVDDLPDVPNGLSHRGYVFFDFADFILRVLHFFHRGVHFL